ncbi:hypothetical protein D3C76_286550 [compost metagenome]
MDQNATGKSLPEDGFGSYTLWKCIFRLSLARVQVIPGIGNKSRIGGGARFDECANGQVSHIDSFWSQIGVQIVSIVAETAKRDSHIAHHRYWINGRQSGCEQNRTASSLQHGRQHLVYTANRSHNECLKSVNCDFFRYRRSGGRRIIAAFCCSYLV